MYPSVNKILVDQITNMLIQAFKCSANKKINGWNGRLKGRMEAVKKFLLFSQGENHFGQGKVREKSVNFKADLLYEPW